MTNRVEVKPWKHRHVYALLLVLAVVAIFLIFSPLGLAK